MKPIYGLERRKKFSNSNPEKFEYDVKGLGNRVQREGIPINEISLREEGKQREALIRAVQDKIVQLFDVGAKATATREKNLNNELACPITELEFSVRTANVLHNGGCNYLFQLVQCGESDIIKMKNSGRKSLVEIRHKLSELGLYFNMTISPENLEELKTKVR